MYYDRADVVVPSGSTYNRVYSTYVNFNYDDIIEITFSSAAQDILKFDDSYKDQRIALPAFHLAYLIYERNKNNNLKVARVLGNVLAIATAIPTGGASLTVIGGISIAVASADIIVTINEDELKKTQAGKTFLDAWSVVQWVDVGLGAMNTGKALYRYGTNTVRRFKFVHGELTSKLTSDMTYGNNLLSQLRYAIKQLENLGVSSYAAILNTKLIARLEATIVKTKFSTVSENAELLIKGEIEGVISIGNSETKLFNMKPSSNGAYIESVSSISTKFSTTDKVIGKFNKVRFKKGNDIVTEDLYIVRTTSGIRLSIYSETFVKDIVTSKIIKTISKYDKKLGRMVDNPMYNNVALGKSSGGSLKQFGDQIGANVWTSETDNVFTSMYDLPDSWSFERSITSVLKQTESNQGKILFDVSNVEIPLAIKGGLVHNVQLVVDYKLVTELELQMILRNSDWFKNTIFHKNGVILTKEELMAKQIQFIE